MSNYRGSFGGGGAQLALPPVTPMLRLILMTLAGAFVVQTMLQLLGLPALIWWLALSGEGLRHFALWQLLTYGLLHGSIVTPQMGNLWHLAMNCLGLWVFGGDVERVLGSKGFLRFFIICVLGGGLLYGVAGFISGSPIPVIGASGGVLGVVLAFAIFFPKRQLILFPIPVPIRAWALAAIYLVLNVYGALANPDGGVAYLAHLGGMGAAFLYLRLMRGGGGAGRGWRSLFRKRPRFEVHRGDRRDPWDLH